MILIVDLTGRLEEESEMAESSNDSSLAPASNPLMLLRDFVVGGYVPT